MLEVVEPNQDPTDATRDPAHRKRRMLIGVAVVSTVVLLQAMAEGVSGHERARSIFRIGTWLAELTLLMVLLNANYAWGERKKHRSIRLLCSSAAIAGVVGVLFAVATGLIGAKFPVLRNHPERPFNLLRTIAFGFVFGQLHGGLWALAFVFPYAVEDARLRALEAERMRTALEVARLRTHLEPHFLLNTLNAISGLVTDDPKHARRLIVCLADLLRDASRGGEHQTVEDEVAWLHRYADILVSRYPDKLRFRWEVADDARSAMMPRLLLQPLVENAVKHGALCRPEGGEVLVRLEVEPIHDRLVCTVEDEGPGFEGEASRPGGLGLSAVRRRLELEYGRADLRLESTSRGTRTTVELPRILGPIAKAAAMEGARS